MNVSLFLQDLAAVMGAGILGPTGQVTAQGLQYSPDFLQTCMCLAVSGYRRWRAPLRPYGSGVLYSQANAGTNVVQVIGGPWAIGQTILIDAFSAQESFIITGIGPGTMLTNWMGVPIAVTLSGNLVNTHAAGIFVGLNPPGMAVIPGTPYYQLPSDFCENNSKTFDFTNGSNPQIKQQQSFYDSAYYYSQRLDGVGWGLTQTVYNSGGGFAYAALPDGVATTNLPNSNAPNETLWQVMVGNPPMLVATPTPQFTATYNWNYYGQHQPETVPQQDADALLDLARAIATSSSLQILAGSLDWKEDDVSESPSSNAKVLAMVEEMARDIFDVKIRKRPFILTG